VGQTSNRQFPYPERTAPPDVNADMKALAQAVDVDMATLLPVGVVVPYVGKTAPNGWLACAGGSYDPAVYPLLHQVLGSPATPTLPDLRERFIKGSTTPKTTGGSKKISTAQLPAHNHPVTVNSGNATHSHSGVTTNNGAHQHGLNYTVVGSSKSDGSQSDVVRQGSAVDVTFSNGDHAHFITTDSQNAPHSHTASSSNTGGGADYEPQFYTMVYIIKAR
jgi:microcystin-dependent protein